MLPKHTYTNTFKRTKKKQMLQSILYNFALGLLSIYMQKLYIYSDENYHKYHLIINIKSRKSIQLYLMKI